MFEQNILNKQCLKNLSDQHVDSIFRLYTQLQSTVLKAGKDELKRLFVERMSDAELKLFKGSSLARALEKIKSNVSDEQGDLEYLNVLLETFIQVQVTSKELNSICLDLVSDLIELLGEPDSKRSSEFSISDYAFTLELAC